METQGLITKIETSVGGREKSIVAFVCQSGSSAEKAFAKLAKTLGIDKIEKTAVFIDPKSKPNKEKDAEIEAFAEMLK